MYTYIIVFITDQFIFFSFMDQPTLYINFNKIILIHKKHNTVIISHDLGTNPPNRPISSARSKSIDFLNFLYYFLHVRHYIVPSKLPRLTYWRIAIYRLLLHISWMSRFQTRARIVYYASVDHSDTLLV